MDISGIFNPPAQQSVSDAIEHAADATGASFDYMLATAQAESNMNPQAASTMSSARGLYQFIEQTWLATLKRSGSALGYGRYADAVVQVAPGRYEVADAAMRREIMALRDDPAANAAMAGALTRDNAAQLAARLGRKPTDGELYIAHVLGSAGAVRLTALVAASPGTAADAVFPAAAEANRAIFYDRQGNSRNVSEVYGALIGRYDGARVSSVAATAGPPPFDLGRVIASVFGAIAPATSAPAPATATAAYTAQNAQIVPAVAPAAARPAVASRGAPAAPASPAIASAVPAAVATTAATRSASAPSRAAPGAVGAPLFRGLFSDANGAAPQFVPDLWKAQPAPEPPPASGAAAPPSPDAAGDLYGGRPRDAAGLFGR